ncbi:12282_t:CDS:10, partial [Dentiscutata erythropus]
MDENSPLIRRSKSVAGYNRNLTNSSNSNRQQKTFKSPERYSITKRPSIHSNLLSVTIDYDQISEEDETWVKSQRDFIKNAEKKPSIRQRLAYECDLGKKGRIWELFDAFLSVLFISFYIFFLPRVWLAKDRLQYVTSPLAIATWIAVFPVIAAFITYYFFVKEMDRTYMDVNGFVYIYPLRFIRANLSVQICFNPVKSSLFKISKLLRKGLRIGTTILFAILVVAAWVHIITYNQEIPKSIDYFDAVWFTVGITSGMSTNIVADNFWLKLVILYIMIMAAMFIPTYLTELISLIQQKSKYDHSFKPGKNIEHIIISGSFDSTSLFEFLREFFCQDHGMSTMNTVAVILNPEEPDDDTALLLDDPAFVNRVQYIIGSPAFRRSLEKVKADEACAAFLLAPKYSKNSDKDDAAQIMWSLALKKYNRKLPIYVQVLLPENVPHFDLLAKDILCIDEISMGLMAQSLVTPGFASLIVLLTTSITEQIARELERDAKYTKGTAGWAIEYINGAQHEIYAATLSDYFTGKTFLECSEIIYTQLEATLFAIGSVKSQLGILLNHSYPFQIFLNPCDYVIKGNEIVFVICDNAEITVRLAHFNTYDHKAKNWTQDMESFIRQPVHKSNDDGCFSSNDAISASTNQSKLKRRKSLNQEESRIQMPTLSDNTHVLLEPRTTALRVEILKHNIDMAKANCDDLLIDPQIKNIENHVLICDYGDKFPLNLDIFIAVLRENHSKCHNMPVVILSNSQPSELQKRTLEKFKDVFFVQGSPLRRYDLFRARVHFAKKCVVLSGMTNNY